MAANWLFIFKDCLCLWAPGDQHYELFPYGDMHEIHVFDVLSGLCVIPGEISLIPSLCLFNSNKKKKCWNTGESDVVFVFIYCKKGYTS